MFCIQMVCKTQETGVLGPITVKSLLSVLSLPRLGCVPPAHTACSSLLPGEQPHQIQRVPSAALPRADSKRKGLPSPLSAMEEELEDQVIEGQREARAQRASVLGPHTWEEA